MQYKSDSPVYQEVYYQDAPITTRLPRLRISPYALDLLGVGAAFLICLACIGMGIYISLRATNEGIPILAAVGCAAVINALLGPKGH